MDSSPPTQSLVARVRGGDRAAFAEAVRTYQRRLFNIGLAMTRNQEDARDILQETLLLAWRSLGSLQDDTRLEAWLCRIATNSARMMLEVGVVSPW